MVQKSSNDYHNFGNAGNITISKRQLRFLILVGGVLLFGAVLTALNVYELHRLTTEHFTKDYEKSKYFFAQVLISLIYCLS